MAPKALMPNQFLGILLGLMDDNIREDRKLHDGINAAGMILGRVKDDSFKWG